MADVQEQKVVITSSNKSDRLMLGVLMTVIFIYMIVSLVLIVHTRKQMAQNQASQQASIHKLLQRQLETQTQLTTSTEALEVVSWVWVSSCRCSSLWIDACWDA